MDGLLLRSRRPLIVYGTTLAIASIVTIAALGGTGIALLVDLPLRTAVWYVLLFTPIMIVIFTAGPVLRLVPGWDRLERWVAGDHDDPEGAFTAIVTLVDRNTRATTVWLGLPVVVIVNGAYWYAVSQDLVIAAATAFGGLLAVAISFVLQAATGELLVTPILREINAAIPGGVTVAPVERTPLSVRVLGVAMAYALGAGFFSAAVGATLGPGRVQLVIVLTAVAVFIATYGWLLVHRMSLRPLLAPIDDLVDATRRVGAGDYGQPVPVTTGDELGTLAASMNAMQTGLRQREQLRSAFGAYVDPSLARRLLTEGRDVFAGERREVTVLFVDVRDFTPFAERSTPEQTVALLNEFFTVVVRAVTEAGGHVNRFLGDGALAVFGAPNSLPGHADVAVRTARRIHAQVREAFDGRVRIGVGINTGPVTAGTVGGAGKLEFTVIGDAVNVAARVEQSTKQTGDVVLLTEATRAMLAAPVRTTSRGLFALKGKSTEVELHALDLGGDPG